MSEIIEIEHSKDKYPDPDWNPKEGEIFQSIISSLSDEDFSAQAKKNLINETKGILGKCINPEILEPQKKTGLVIGHVQSGKTTSFTSLIGLALDNNFHLVIVLGGRVNSLLKQNVDEISKSLAKFQDDVHTFSVDLERPNRIEQILGLEIPDALDDSEFFSSNKTVSIHLKHYDHINKVAEVLEANRNLAKNLNALIIDDEADNASLNNMVTDQEQSSTYSAITRLRDVLPRHSLVQYTATPQAILLTNRDDHYNPEWVRFVTPGEKYIGTKEIFNDDAYSIRNIKPSEVYEDEIINEELPPSFISALVCYLLCVSESVQPGSQIIFDRNLSMMVHPSRIVRHHAFWGSKIKALFNNWKYEIKNNDDQFNKTYKAIFKEEFDDLQYTASKANLALTDFENLYSVAKQSLKRIVINELNSANNKVDFKHRRYNLIIGGDLLDRGFVVKGLVTTYMPRKISANTDTLQQRGRFYGYKKDHQSVVKIFLTQESKNAFIAYAKTEADLYSRLKDHLMRNRSLKSWRRIFMLDKSFELCRKSVIGIELTPKILNQNGWFVSRWAMDARYNLQTIKSLLRKYEDSFNIFNTEDHPSENWTDTTKSIIAEYLPTDQVIASLEDFIFDPAEQEKWISVQTLLGSMSYKNFRSSVVFVGTTKPTLDSIISKERGTKSADGSYELTAKLWQGDNKARNYPGGQAVVAGDDQITFQFHRFHVKNKLTNEIRPSFNLSIKLPSKETIVKETNQSFELDYIYDDDS